jgi:hypothetical protein
VKPVEIVFQVLYFKYYIEKEPNQGMLWEYMEMSKRKFTVQLVYANKLFKKV